MRFASLGGQGNYAQAGRAVADDMVKSLDASRRNAPRFDDIARVAMKTKGEQEVAQIKAKELVDRAEIKADAKIKTTKEDIKQKDIVAKSRRKAGVVAALGKAGAGLADVFMGEPKKRDHSASIALQERLTNSAEELRSGIKPIDFNAFNNTNPPASGSNTSNDSSGNSSSGGNNTGGTAASSSSTTSASAGGTKPGTAEGTTSAFTPEEIKAFDITGLYESDSSGGYNAYNLGGSQGGTVAHGSGNSSNGAFGKPLTQMTIGEVRQLGNSGKIHATGRYQFTHNTGSFGEAVKFAGLSDNDLFNEENQNRMFLAFGQKYGTSRWVGLNKATPEERAAVQSAFNNWQP